MRLVVSGSGWQLSKLCTDCSLIAGKHVWFKQVKASPNFIHVKFLLWWRLVQYFSQRHVTLNALTVVSRLSSRTYIVSLNQFPLLASVALQSDVVQNDDSNMLFWYAILLTLVGMRQVPICICCSNHSARPILHQRTARGDVHDFSGQMATGSQNTSKHFTRLRFTQLSVGSFISLRQVLHSWHASHESASCLSASAFPPYDDDRYDNSSGPI